MVSVSSNSPDLLPINLLPTVLTNFPHLKFFEEKTKIQTFQAQTTIIEKMMRVVKPLIFGGGIIAVTLCFLGVHRKLTFAISVLSGLTLARKIVEIAIGYASYPVATVSLINSSVKLSDYLLDKFPGLEEQFSSLSLSGLQKTKKMEVESLLEEGFFVKNVTLFKSGVKYDAVLISHPKTIDNGNWAIHALGNGMAMEDHIYAFAKQDLIQPQCSTLLVNGPSVGESGGWPTRYQLGAGFEAGLQFLEKEIKAKKVIMHGFSLGGGMLAEAILNHDFTAGLKNKTDYLFIADRTFSRLSTIAGAMISTIVKPIFYLVGMELDGIGAARKLSQLGIKQIVIQHTSEDGTGSDGVIYDDASLAYVLKKDPINKEHITFIESTQMNHNGNLPGNNALELKTQIHHFLFGKPKG